MISEQTGLSYTHLSRIENDSSIPGAETVARLAEALGGDLKLMLELADCLPRQILDRISNREQTNAPALRRAAGGQPPQRSIGGLEGRALTLVRAAGVPEAESDHAADAIVRLLRLDPRRRRALIQLVRSFIEETHGGKS